MDDKVNNLSYLNNPIPRLTIHVFAISEPFLQAVESASRDRRMYKTTTHLHKGGVEAATAYYQERSTPDLLIIESNDTANLLIKQLIELAKITEVQTKVMIATSINDVALYREINRCQVADCITLPATALEIIDTIAGTYRTHTPRGQMISFLSTKGGAGSSILASNTAWYLSENTDENVLLVDYDLYLGTAAYNFNILPEKNLGDLLEMQGGITDDMIESTTEKLNLQLRILAASGALVRDHRFTAGSCEAIADSVRRISSCAIFDLPYGFLQNTRETLLMSDTVVLVTTPDNASMRNMVDMYNALHDARPHDKPPLVVLNQNGMPGRGTMSAMKFESYVGFRPDFIIPFDPELFGAAAQEQTVPAQLKKMQTSNAIAGLERLAQALTSKRVPTTSGVSQKTSSGSKTASVPSLSGLLKKILR